MKKEFNPKLEVGDRVSLVNMNDPYSPVIVGTTGVVTGISEVMGELIYYMKWDDGSTLSLIPETDLYLKINNSETKDNLKE